MRALLSPSILLVPTLLAITVSTYPNNAPVVIARQAGSSPAPTTPPFTALISSTNGTDISSSFQIFVYTPNNGGNNALDSNLTDRSLAPRGLRRVVLPIDRCRAQPSRFLYSQCDHIPGRPDAMLRFNRTCKLPVSSARSRTPHYGAGSVRFTETGTCRRDEICINGRRRQVWNGRSLEYGPSTASCVSYEQFKKPQAYGPQFSTKAALQQFLSMLRGNSASAAFSHVDGRTPMEVEAMRMSAAIANPGTGLGEERVVDQESCTNCVDLNTGVLEEAVDSLKMQATVAAGVGTAGAGILWLAALSG